MPPVNGVLYITQGADIPVPSEGELNFGTTNEDEPVTKTLRAWNYGPLTLTLDAGDFQIPPGYALIGAPGTIPPWSFPNPPTWGEFQLRLLASSPGQYNGDVLITNDAGYLPNPYIIHVLGTVDADLVDNAEVVSHTLPSSLSCEDNYMATVTMRNTGTTTWVRDGEFGYKLGMNGDGDPFHNGRVRLPHGVTVPPNGTHTFEFNMTAPEDSGTYLSDWRMFYHVQGSGDEHFGEVAARTVAVSCVEINDAEVVSHTLPGTMTCGDTYVARVTMRNIGTTTWTREGEFGHKLGANGDGDWFHSGRVRLPQGVSVPPGGTHTFSFTMTAPQAAGSYLSDWRMFDHVPGSGDEWFGEVASRTVVVSCLEIKDAEVVHHTLPTSLACGATYQATVTMCNTGTTTWVRDGEFGYKLGMNGDGAPFHNGRIRLPHGTTVAPGQKYTFVIDMTATDGPGTHVSDWRMFHHVQGSGDEHFGAIASRTVQVSCALINDAEVVNHTLPASMTCGQSYQATVTMRNTGTTTWVRDGEFGYKLGMNGDGDPFHSGRIRLPHGTRVVPGQSHTFTISMTAPEDPGSYLSDWRMFLHVQGPGDEWFGEVAARTITVNCN